MDISPESTPTEESSLQGHASVKALHSSATAGTPVSTPRSLERSELLTPASTPSSSVQDKVAVAAASSTSVCSQTALATLAALQQAVSQVTVDKTPPAPGSTSVQRAQTSSILSCLALLPALISQLNTDRLANSQTRPQERHQNEQITKQGMFAFRCTCRCCSLRKIFWCEEAVCFVHRPLLFFTVQPNATPPH